jgi:hypothetical protein
MESTFARIEELADHVKEYLNTKIDAVKLNTAAKTSRIISNFVAGLVVTLFFFLFIIFISISTAYALSAWIGKMYAGFLIVAGVYFLIAVVIWSARERLLRIPIMNSLIRQLFKEEINEED